MKVSIICMWVVASVPAAPAIKLHSSASQEAMANPIRKVVTMLRNVQKKVEAEGEKEEELYEKFMCYCKTSGGDLAKSIAAAEAKVPEVSSAIEEATANKKQTDADIVAHKKDREDAKAAMAEATALREKEAKAFAASKADSDANVLALAKAVKALEAGMGGSFLQTRSATVLRNILQSSLEISDGDREDLMAFLSAKQGAQYAPQSGEIVGILKQMGDEMSKDLMEAIAVEEASVKSYDELMAAKTKEVNALTASIEEKTVRTGELAVSIVEMKEDLDDTEKALVEDQQFLADLDNNCDTKTKEWEDIKKVRAEELLAIADTIKILNDDDALELFKKTLPSPVASLVQVQVSGANVRARALAQIKEALHASKTVQPQLNLIAIALHGKSAGEFDKVLKMIDEMVALLKEEQVSDDDKKQYCESEFDKTDDKKKALDRSVSDSEKAIADAQESIATLTSEIEALTEGIQKLDRSVTEATEQRKEQNEDFKEWMAQDAAAKELLEFAKNRLNKFYNPKLYVPPPERELSAEDQIVVSFGGTAAPTPAPGGIAGTGVEVFAQVSGQHEGKVAPPPPPETFGPYTKKSQESTGVIAMMDMLIADLDKEMTIAEQDEKDAQADYESMMEESAKKRASDSKSITEKEGLKAETQAALQKHTDDKSAATKELMGTLETIQALHAECDWLLQNFEARKGARASEIDSLVKAKGVLSGADFA